MWIPFIHMAPHSRPNLILLLAAGLLLASCKDTKITSYRVPKEPVANTGAAPLSAPAPVANTNDLPPAGQGSPASVAPANGALPPGHPAIEGMPAPGDAGTAMASASVSTAASQPLVWTAPAGWTPKKASAMRKGSYSISGPEGAGDVSITAFPGDVGGNLANVNRWRGQLQLPPVQDVATAVQPLDTNGLHLLVFEGANQGTRMIGVIVPQSDATWFFKLTGPDALVAREKPAFLDFLKTVRAP
jgi:hypothetical protein